MRLSHPVLVAFVAVLSGCPPLNDCTFMMRCDGGVLEQCGGGPDQQLGRKVEATACDGLNPICVQEGEAAGCFASADPCDAGMSRCEGHIAYACSTIDRDHRTLQTMPRAYLFAEDCSSPVREPDGGVSVATCRQSTNVAWCD